MADVLDPFENISKKSVSWAPKSAVWEITLACNLRCRHCGSRAGKPLENELSTEECFDLVDQLGELGCELITLSGGEPTLRSDWDRIARHIADRKMLVNMVTNGVYAEGISGAEIAERALAAGMCNVGVSIDGPRSVHDRIRGKGAFEKTAASVRAFKKKGLSTTVMAAVNRLNIDHLWDLRTVAASLGARAVRFQLAKPMGTMDDHREWLLPPERIATLLPELARMKQQGGIDVRVGDSLGYYGKPDSVLRGKSWRNKRSRWGGCQAGLQALGIQADGSIKGCLSLQADRRGPDPFVEGNVRESSLSEIWNRPGAFAYNREFKIDDLSHDCRECSKASQCRGGARCISTAVDGTLSHDDYCYFRLTGERDAGTWIAAGKTAAAAAALVLAVNTQACGTEDIGGPYGADGGNTGMDTSSDTQTDTEVSSDFETDTDRDTASDTAPDVDYGMIPDTEDTSVLEYAVEPDYGMIPDTEDTSVLEYAVEPDYGTIPDTEEISDADYAVTPD